MYNNNYLNENLRVVLLCSIIEYSKVNCLGCIMHEYYPKLERKLCVAKKAGLVHNITLCVLA